MARAVDARLESQVLAVRTLQTPPPGLIIRRGGLTMKTNYVRLTLFTLVLTAGALQHKAASKIAVYETSATDQNTSQTEWRVFTSRAGGFSVLMPGTPKEETEVKEFPVVGKGETHLFVLATESGVYVAGYVAVPGLARQSQSFCDNFGTGFLKSVGEATAKGAGGRVIKETDISFGRDPGKEILIEVPAGRATVRAYFVKRRGYELIAAPTAGSDPANVKKFLDSFKVTAQ
jgi:hypothetical protein